jgi:glutathione peroxidase
MKMITTFGLSAILLGAGLALIQQSQAAKTTSAKTAIKNPTKAKKGKVPPILNFKMNSLTGKPVDLSQYKGNVVMIVNTASKCGMTPQYAGLQKLHEKYSPQGLRILGFPANDFGQQEPGSDAEIGDFCEANYGVKFPMFSKIAVTGANKAPLYKLLTEPASNPQFAGEVGWNFEKFLISRDGKIVARFRSGVTPESDEIKAAIEAQLAIKPK